MAAPKTPKPRAVRTRDERRRALDVIAYELDQCVDSLTLHRWYGGQDALSNSLLESQLIHVRALTAFVLDDATKARPTDIIRADIVDDAAWVPQPQDCVDRLEAALDVLHKTLAHITWGRVLGEPTEWPHASLASDVTTVLGAWHNYAQKTLGDVERVDSILTPLTVSLERARDTLAQLDAAGPAAE